MRIEGRRPYERALWQAAAKVVKNCLKRDLIAVVGRAKVPKKANFLLHVMALLGLILGAAPIKVPIPLCRFRRPVWRQN